MDFWIVVQAIEIFLRKFFRISFSLLTRSSSSLMALPSGVVVGPATRFRPRERLRVVVGFVGVVSGTVTLARGPAGPLIVFGGG